MHERHTCLLPIAVHSWVAGLQGCRIWSQYGNWGKGFCSVIHLWDRAYKASGPFQYPVKLGQHVERSHITTMVMAWQKWHWQNCSTDTCPYILCWLQLSQGQLIMGDDRLCAVWSWSHASKIWIVIKSIIYANNTKITIMMSEYTLHPIGSRRDTPGCYELV